MKRKRFTEEQIVGVLREHEAGGTAREVCRRHAKSEQTFYRWKSKYGGMKVCGTRRLRELEAAPDPRPPLRDVLSSGKETLLDGYI